jgi:hypothetical protein
MSIAGVALVKEIHRGTGDAFNIRGCRPGKSYQFRIKGEYSDGSYIWSDICEIYMRQPGTEVRSSLPANPEGLEASKADPRRYQDWCFKCL